MHNVRVPLFGNVAKSVTIDADATDGAILGVNLRNPDGSLVTSLGGGTAPPSNDLTTSDDLDEGGYNLYFTNKRAQDAVGAILADTDTIDLAYAPNTPAITATLKDLADAGTGQLVGITRDAKGRVSGTRDVDTDDLEEGTTNLYFTDARAQAAVRLVFNRIDAAGDIRVDAAGDLRITY